MYQNDFINVSHKSQKDMKSDDENSIIPLKKIKIQVLKEEFY